MRSMAEMTKPLVIERDFILSSTDISDSILIET
jgi:hypothetical protein